MQLDQRLVLLIGASGGIGRATARRLAAAGARLWLCGRDEARLQQLAAELGPGHRYFAGDLSLRAQQRCLFAQIDGPVDILINAAGCNHFALFEDTPSETIEAMMRLDLLLPMQLCQLFLPKLARPGLILNVGSALGSLGHPGYSVYGACKAALFSFSQTLDRELRGQGIRVLHLAPRATLTAGNSPQVQAFNRACKVHQDSPEQVASVLLDTLQHEHPDRRIGAPERFFAWLNGIAPQLFGRLLAPRLSQVRYYTQEIGHD